MSKSTFIFFRGVPRRLKREFRTACARRGSTMKDVLVQHIKECCTGDIPIWKQKNGIPYSLDKTCVVFLRGISHNLKDIFKASCYAMDVTMKERIVAFMIEYVESFSRARITAGGRKL